MRTGERLGMRLGERLDEIESSWHFIKEIAETRINLFLNKYL